MAMRLGEMYHQPPHEVFEWPASWFWATWQQARSDQKAREAERQQALNADRTGFKAPR